MDNNKWLILYRHTTKSIIIRHIDNIKYWEWKDYTTIDSAATRREAWDKREQYLGRGKQNEKI